MPAILFSGLNELVTLPPLPCPLPPRPAPPPVTWPPVVRCLAQAGPRPSHTQCSSHVCQAGYVHVCQDADTEFPIKSLSSLHVVRSAQPMKCVLLFDEPNTDPPNRTLVVSCMLLVVHSQ